MGNLFTAIHTDRSCPRGLDELVGVNPQPSWQHLSAAQRRRVIEILRATIAEIEASLPVSEQALTYRRRVCRRHWQRRQRAQ